MSGADLEQVCNHAAILATKRAIGSSENLSISQCDFEEALRDREPTSTGLDRLDLFLGEASAGLATPANALFATLELKDGARETGRIVWADGQWLKLFTGEKDARIFNRSHVRSIFSASGTAALHASELLQAATSRTPDVG